VLVFDPEQRHQRENAALAVIVDAHGEADIFDACDDDERPQDERQGAKYGHGVGFGAGEIEHGFERVERAGADIAKYDAERGQPEDRQGALGRFGGARAGHGQDGPLAFGHRHAPR
jgi:hypothetical protein